MVREEILTPPTAVWMPPPNSAATASTIAAIIAPRRRWSIEGRKRLGLIAPGANRSPGFYQRRGDILVTASVTCADSTFANRKYRSVPSINGARFNLPGRGQYPWD